MTTSYAAIVEPVNQVGVVPLATGRIDKLTVDVGSEVRKGQVIAALSHGTLDAQLQQAQATLNSTQARLASIQAAIKPSRLKAQAQLDAAQARLNQLLNPSASDIQVAESAVATAQSKLDSAKTKLDQLHNPLASDLRVARNAVATAQSKMDSAKIELDQLLTASDADLAEALATVAGARADLSTAQAELNQAIAKDSSWQILLGHRISLQANRATLDNPALNRGLTPEEIADAEQAIVANQEQISILLRQFSSSSLIAEDIWNSTSLISEEIRSSLWNESKALRALETASAKLRELQEPSDRTVTLAQNYVAVAQDSLDSAKAKFTELEKPSDGTVAQARYDVEAAQASLEATLARLNQLNHPRPADLAAAKAAVATAEQTLALNQEAYTQHDIQAEHARVDQAKAQVRLVEQQLEELKVLVPFDGFVTKRWLAPGAMASPQTPIVTVFSQDVMLSLRIEETGVNSLQRGQRVQFTSPGLPSQRLELRIDGIAPSGEPAAHAFSVQMSPVGAAPDLKPGMSGQVSILTQHEKVVLVPKEAVLRREGQFALFVVRDGRAHSVEVARGLTDHENTEILSGVRRGDQVVVFGQNLLSDDTPVVIDTSAQR